jgi:hypothetical protein
MYKKLSFYLDPDKDYWLSFSWDTQKPAVRHDGETILSMFGNHYVKNYGEDWWVCQLGPVIRKA